MFLGKRRGRLFVEKYWFLKLVLEDIRFKVGVGGVERSRKVERFINNSVVFCLI